MILSGNETTKPGIKRCKWTGESIFLKFEVSERIVEDLSLRFEDLCDSTFIATVAH